MKYLKYLLIIYIGFLTSCNSILEENPKDFVGPQEFYQNRNQCISGINGAYIPLNSIYNQTLMIITEATTDLAFLNSSSVDAKLELSPSSPGNGQTIWSNCYKGVMRCNAVYNGIQKAPIETEEKKDLIGEIVTLRALYYYVLTSTFGDVPFYTTDVTSSFDILDQITKLPRMSAKETRSYLISELLENVPFLEHKRTVDIEGNRIAAPVAYMIIAKMAMWNKEYEIASESLSKLIEIYGELDQYDLKETYFREKNTPESIFEVQFTWSVTGLRKTNTVACFFTPSKTKNTDIYDGVSIPELGSKANPYTSLTPSDHLIKLYDKSGGNDPRSNIIIAREYNGTWFNRPTSNNGNGKPWMGPKFWCPGMDNVSDGNNQKVFRYADAILMKAECANELGDYNTAINYLNKVRSRAGIPIISKQLNKEELFEEIKDERARELMGEYGRKFDLVRWGLYYDAIKSTIANEFHHVASNLRPAHEYYPIPDREVVRSGGSLTNDAYDFGE